MCPNPLESQLERLARTLTERFGVTVTCQGDGAWTDGRQIRLPSLPEPMDDPLERMVVGFLDHEMGHVAFSDFRVVKRFASRHPGFEGLLNVVEDARIEDRAMRRWPGVRANLDAMFEQVRDRVVALAAQAGAFDRFCTAVYLKLAHYRDLLGLEAALAGYEDLLSGGSRLRSTRDAAELAERILARWQRNQAEPGSAPLEPAAPQDQDRSDDRGSDAPPQAGSEPGDDVPAERGAEPDQSDATSGSDRSRQDEEPGDNRSSQRDGEETADGAAPQSSPSPSPAQGDGQADDQKSPQEPDTPAPAERESIAVSAPEGQEPVQPGTSTVQVATGQGGDTVIARALIEAIVERVARLDPASVYRVYTKQHDRLDLVPAAGDTEVKALLETDTDTVRRLRRGLVNALRSAEKRWWREDQIQGSLSPRSLYRLGTDRARLDVFRSRATAQGRSTAVSVLLDASGSMSHSKITVARKAMRVLLEALADLRIATEGLTFTTGWRIDMTEACKQAGVSATWLRERFGRISNLEIGLIKRFADPVGVALRRLPSVAGTGLTPLGEAMQIAASRLAPRPETRKILLVLTDGRPGCEGGAACALAHARHVARLITDVHIELVGVGILDPSIGSIVKDAITIQKIEDLPAQLCKLLGRALRKGVYRVG